MSSKIIGAIAAVVIVIGGYFAYRYTQLQADAAKWSGPIKEIAEESITKVDDVSHIRFVSIVEAPLAKVQQAMWGVERGQETVENIRLSKLIKQEGNKKEVEIQVQLLSLPLQQFTMEFTLDEQKHRMDFHTTQSTSQDLTGSYQLEPSPDGARTRVTYEVKAKPKVPVPLPQSVQDSAQKEFFVNTIRGVKKRAQEVAG